MLAAVVALCVIFELTPLPRPLYSAAVPDVYRMVAARGDESGRLLELPTGIRDGTSSMGNPGGHAVLPDRAARAGDLITWRR